MEKIFQITTNYALVQAGFFDVIIKDVFIDEQCLIENNMCINATDTDRRMLTSRTRTTSSRTLRTLRVFQRVFTGQCRICCSRRIVSDTVVIPGRKLTAKEPNEPKSSKAPKETQFSDVRYTNFFEDTVSEEYAMKLATQQDLLADPNAPSDVATLCRLYGNFLND
eukprot:scaffold125902_cov55-Attheya_sp.AAC.2